MEVAGLGQQQTQTGCSVAKPRLINVCVCTYLQLQLEAPAPSQVSPMRNGRGAFIVAVHSKLRLQAFPANFSRFSTLHSFSCVSPSIRYQLHPNLH